MATASQGGGAASAATPATGAWRGLAGFFITGLLFSFLGAILPAWRHHLTEDFVAVGNYFLSMNLGILAGLALSRVLPRRRLHVRMSGGCALACAVFVYLALLPPGLSPWWRIGSIFFLGVATTVLNTSIFQIISPLYRHDPATTISLGGALFGAGCIALTALVAGAFYAYSLSTILLFLALFPAVFLVVYARSRFQAPAPGSQPSFRQALADFKSASAVMFMLLLFFQFGNEWSLAGWLPLYLVQRLGISPASALVMLSVYWLALVAGRFVVFWMLPSVSHKKVLGACVLAALFGCTILMVTDNRFGAVTGILLVGGGFASIYPLVAEQIGGRFPYYHPGAFNGIFSFALTGGLLAPWSLGLLVDAYGMQMVMVLPLLGTVMVFVLLVLIWAEARLRRGTSLSLP